MVPFILAVTIAFVKIKGIPFIQFVLLTIENSFFRPPRRYWFSGGRPFISMTTGFKLKNEKPKILIPPKETLSKKRIKKLAQVMDGKGIKSKK